jgi:hypothetical protein
MFGRTSRAQDDTQVSVGDGAVLENRGAPPWRALVAAALLTLMLAALLPGAARAEALAPGVTTERASSVAKTTATLNATVDPNEGTVSECYFEYGTSEAYGATVPCTSLPGSGENEVGVSAPVGSLTESTTYHFRIVATNEVGTTYGADRMFTTLPDSPKAVTGSASSVAFTTATLNATVNPNDENVTDCYFEYGTSVAYGKSAACTSLPGSGASEVGVSTPLSGLTEGTTYHFRIVATNELGTSFGADRAFTTMPNSPTVVTGKASSITPTTATFNASVNPHGKLVSDCHFEYGTSVAYGTSVSCASGPGSGESPVAVSAPVGSLSESTTYHFRIVATNERGTSYGADKTFKTPPHPPAVVTEKASSVTPTTATLNASVNPNGANVTDCHFEYGTSVGYGTSVACASPPGAGESEVAVSAPVGSLSESTTYHFRIVATNGLGTTYGADKAFRTPPHPPAVVTDSASAIGASTATLNATVNPGDSKVTDCHFEYGTSVAYGSSVPCASLPGSGESPVAVSAGATSLSASTTYHFRIVATNALGTSYGPDKTFTTEAAGLSPTVKKISPKSGPATGHTVVTVTGTNFTGATAVMFGLVEGIGLKVNSATSITVESPEEAVGTVSVIVITPSGMSESSAKTHFKFKKG